MNILFISAVLPYPLHSGGQIRIYNLLKRLAKRHTITLLSFIRDENERAYVSKLPFLSNVRMVYRGKAMQPKYLFNALGNLSWLLSTYNNDEMKQLIQEEITKHTYDLVHIEPFYVYPSLPRLSIPLVVAEHNIEYSIYEQYVKKFPIPFLRPFLFTDVVKTRVWEESVWKKSSGLIAVSAEDKAVMQKIRTTDISIVPNGVDCNAFMYHQRSITEENLSCLFIGDFAWMPNREAVAVLLKNIWPSIVKRFPRATLTIVGKQLPSSMKKLLTNKIQYIERVSDIHDTYNTHNILLAPMGIGGGTKFKLLEAFATGVVVVTSQQGVMGLSVRPTVDYFEATSSMDYVHALETICREKTLVKTMTSHARSIIENEYNWDRIAEHLDVVWKNSL